MTTSVTHRNDNETCLSQPIGTYGHFLERIDGSFDLRTRIDIVDDRIDLGRIEVEGLVHDTIEIGHAIGGLHLKGFRELITGCQQL